MDACNCGDGSNDEWKTKGGDVRAEAVENYSRQVEVADRSHSDVRTSLSGAVCRL